MSDERNTEERWRDLEREVKDPPMKFIVQSGEDPAPTMTSMLSAPDVFERIASELVGIHQQLARIADAVCVMALRRQDDEWIPEAHRGSYDAMLDGVRIHARRGRG